MHTQVQHHTSPFTPQKFPILLVCDRITSPANIGGLFRIADSFGIPEIHFCGAPIPIKSKRMQRTARATHQRIPFVQHHETLDCVDRLTLLGYTPIALEITTDSIPITNYTFNPCHKIALVIGEENSGVAKSVLQKVSKSIHIPMYGHNSSMNVTTATSIALYEITKQFNSLP